MRAETAMETAEKVEDLETGLADRRGASRYGLDEQAYLLLVERGFIVPCRILELSLDGCRVYTPEWLSAESMMCVEVNFKVQGLSFRFSGSIQWTDCRHTAGIRFTSLPKRRREELVDALSEIKAKNAAMAAAQDTEEQATAERFAEMRVAEEQAAALKPAAAVKRTGQETPESLSVQSPAQAIVAPSAAQASAQPSKRERRESFREAVDTSAVIDLIRIASRLPGRILDLSLSGCRICTDEPFPVGIYTRVETEFRLDGLPFRLGGVIQGIHDRRTVGIRFLDMSSRKREQVEQLMDEIREKREAE
jgi:hypothetical protein